MPDVDRAARLQAMKDAVGRLLEEFRDVVGPECWCDDLDDCERRPCPSVPPTVGLSAWVVVMEWDDIDPDGCASTSWRWSSNAGPNRVLGLLTRAAREV